MLQYPSDLPGPDIGSITSAERRLHTPIPGPMRFRAAQRDRLAFQKYQFTLTADQAETFQEWWETELYKGGAWFGATWPLPYGIVVGVRKFLSIAWNLVGGDVWRISGVFEVRGRGMLPEVGAGAVSVINDIRITEDEDTRITEEGDTRFIS